MKARRAKLALAASAAIAVPLAAWSAATGKIAAVPLELPATGDARGVAELEKALDEKVVQLDYELSSGPFDARGNFTDALSSIREWASISIVLSPAARAFVRDPSFVGLPLTVAGQCSAREALELVLRAAGTREPSGRIEAVVEKARRIVHRDGGMFRYRVHGEGRVVVSLVEESAPPGIDARPDTDTFTWQADGAEMAWVADAGFLADVRPVSVAQYGRFLDAIERGGHARCPADESEKKDHHPTGWGTDEYLERCRGVRGPVLGVDLDDARAYAAWAGKKLPSGSEWTSVAMPCEAPSETSIWGAHYEPIREWTRSFSNQGIEVWRGGKITWLAYDQREPDVGFRCVAPWPER